MLSRMIVGSSTETCPSEPPRLPAGCRRAHRFGQGFDRARGARGTSNGAPLYGRGAASRGVPGGEQSFQVLGVALGLNELIENRKVINEFVKMVIGFTRPAIRFNPQVSAPACNNRRKFSRFT